MAVVKTVVTAAAHYGGATMFFHDDRVYPEETGFWTLGRNITEVLEMTPEYQRYRDVQTGEEATMYRLPKSALRCSDSDT